MMNIIEIARYVKEKGLREKAEYEEYKRLLSEGEKPTRPNVDTRSTKYKQCLADLHAIRFYPRVTQIIGSIPVHSPKITESILSCPDKVKCVDGNTYSNKEIMAYFIILKYLDTRSVFVSANKSKHLYPRFAGLTPIGMYAFREAQGIDYSYWDTTDKHFDALVSSKLLYTAIRYAETVDKPDMDTILAARKYMVENGKPLSTHTKPKGFTDAFPIIGGGGMGYQALTLQTWIAQPGVRVEDAMLLDLYDFDNVPKPIEMAKKEKPAKSALRYDEDLTLD